MNSQQNQPLSHSQSSSRASGSPTLPTSLPLRPFPQTALLLIPAPQTYSPCPHNRAIPKTDQTNPVCTAGNVCHPDATAANNIAVTPAGAPRTANASVTLANSKCNAPVTPAHCGVDNNGNFAAPLNPAAHPKPQAPAFPVSAPDPTSTSGDIDAKTAVSTPSQATLAVTAVTLATGRRHTATNQQLSDIPHYIQTASPTLLDDTTESDRDDSLRSCHYCGELFQFRSVKHKYCSNACRVYAHYVRHGGRKCKVCGQPTPSPSRSVCSEVCRAQLPYYRPGCYAENPTHASRE